MGVSLPHLRRLGRCSHNRAEKPANTPIAAATETAHVADTRLDSPTCDSRCQFRRIRCFHPPGRGGKDSLTCIRCHPLIAMRQAAQAISSVDNPNPRLGQTARP